MMVTMSSVRVPTVARLGGGNKAKPATRGSPYFPNKGGRKAAPKKASPKKVAPKKAAPRKSAAPAPRRGTIPLQPAKPAPTRGTRGKKTEPKEESWWQANFGGGAMVEEAPAKSSSSSSVDPMTVLTIGAVLGGGALVATNLTDIFEGFFQTVGFFYSLYFAWKNLLFEDGREALSKDVALVAEKTGLEDVDFSSIADSIGTMVDDVVEASKGMASAGGEGGAAPAAPTSAAPSTSSEDAILGKSDK